MARLKDETGNKYGKLIVIRRAENYISPKGFTIPRWECKCECGRTITLLAGSLRSGKTQSCGCIRKEVSRKRGKQRHLAPGEAIANHILSEYKISANRRRLEFTLTKQEFLDLSQQDCFFCGRKPEQTRQALTCYGKFVYNGIDRLDNSKGYTTDNCIPCCWKCNRAKATMSAEEYVKLCQAVIAKHSISLGTTL